MELRRVLASGGSAVRPSALPRRARGGTVAALVVALVASACLPGQLIEVRARSAASGYPGIAVHSTKECVYRLDGTTPGWITLLALSVEPAHVLVHRATVTGLPAGPRDWYRADDQSAVTQVAQEYELWRATGSGEVLTASIAPGESFRVEYETTTLDGGRTIPAGNANVGVRVLSDAREPLVLVEESCDGGSDTIVPGLSPIHTTIDWDAAVAAQAAAVAGGLVLPTDPLGEWSRLIFGECGQPTVLSVADPMEPFLWFEVDNAADVTVAVLGDSITSQIRDELVEDTRFDWITASICGAVIESWLDDPTQPGVMDLTWAFDALLAAEPDVVIVATGTVDTMRFPGADYAAVIDRLADELDDVPCVVWTNVFASDHVDPANPGWKADALRFDAELLDVAAEHGIVVADWHAVADAAGAGLDHPWVLNLAFDLFHVTVPTGHQARVGLTLSAAEACTG